MSKYSLPMIECPMSSEKLNPGSLSTCRTWFKITSKKLQRVQGQLWPENCRFKGVPSFFKQRKGIPSLPFLACLSFSCGIVWNILLTTWYYEIYFSRSLQHTAKKPQKRTKAKRTRSKNNKSKKKQEAKKPRRQESQKPRKQQKPDKPKNSQ